MVNRWQKTQNGEESGKSIYLTAKINALPIIFEFLNYFISYIYLIDSIKTNVGNGTVSSHLYLATASANDSGTYSCNVANMATATLMLHILNGKFW